MKLYIFFQNFLNEKHKHYYLHKGHNFFFIINNLNIRFKTIHVNAMDVLHPYIFYKL